MDSIHLTLTYCYHGLLQIHRLSCVLDLEAIGVLSIQIHHLVTQPGLFHRLLKVRKWREENIVIANTDVSMVNTHSPY